jgi:hypothetical protein
MKSCVQIGAEGIFSGTGKREKSEKTQLPNKPKTGFGVFVLFHPGRSSALRSPLNSLDVRFRIVITSFVGSALRDNFAH